jgi:ribonuclease D
MRNVLDEEFIPHVMENQAVEKWAHYARFERRFLGENRARNLNCTFQLARSIPYYQLPMRSLSLAALVEKFCGVVLDKTFQKADWGQRPLSQELRAYAAADTEWCYRVHGELLKIPRPPTDPSEDDPEEIKARYLGLLIPIKTAQTTRTGIREAVREYMTKENVRRLSRFALDARTTHSTDLATLVEFALTRDPGGYFDLTISLRADLRSQLAPDSLAKIRSVAEPRLSQSFRSPHAPRMRGETPPPYDLDPGDPERLTNDYEDADHEVMVYESERGELRDRMKRWMRAQAVEGGKDLVFRVRVNLGKLIYVRCTSRFPSNSQCR